MTVELELQCLHANMVSYCIHNDSMKQITVRCSDEEYKLLLEYCEKKERTQNDVLRELIRTLKKEGT